MSPACAAGTTSGCGSSKTDCFTLLPTAVRPTVGSTTRNTHTSSTDLIGVFGIVRKAAEPFSDEVIELVQTFADQAAIAIANARLLDAVERQLEQQRAISDLLAAVARSEGLESVFHELVEVTARLCDAEFGEVHLVEGDLLRLAVGHGGPPELYEYEREHPH